jgi:elongation factor Ts
MAITATMVRELRDMTGAAMMDCKKALEASGGDMQAAIDHLRKQGLKSAAKKASRETGEGRVFLVQSENGRRGQMVGVACETDFLAGSEKFKAFVDELAETVRDTDPDGAEDGSRPLLAQRWHGSDTPVSGRIQETIGQFGENIRVTDLARFECPEGRVGGYIHHDKKQGAIVSVRTSADAAKADDLLRALCQHIVVFMPGYLNAESVPAEEVEREKAVIRESDEVKKKPAEFQSKIIEGKLRRFYAEKTLEEQPWIHDDKLTVQRAIEKELGRGTKIQGFRRIRIGG